VLKISQSGTQGSAASVEGGQGAGWQLLLAGPASSGASLSKWPKDLIRRRGDTISLYWNVEKTDKKAWGFRCKVYAYVPAVLVPGEKALPWELELSLTLATAIGKLEAAHVCVPTSQSSPGTAVAPKASPKGSGDEAETDGGSSSTQTVLDELEVERLVDLSLLQSPFDPFSLTPVPKSAPVSLTSPAPTLPARVMGEDENDLLMDLSGKGPVASALCAFLQQTSGTRVALPPALRKPLESASSVVLAAFLLHSRHMSSAVALAKLLERKPSSLGVGSPGGSLFASQRAMFASPNKSPNKSSLGLAPLATTQEEKESFETQRMHEQALRLGQALAPVWAAVARVQQNLVLSYQYAKRWQFLSEKLEADVSSGQGE